MHLFRVGDPPSGVEGNDIVVWLLGIDNRHRHFQSSPQAQVSCTMTYYICEVCKLQPNLYLASCLYPLRNFLQYPFTTAAVSQSLGMALLGQKSYTVINSEDIRRRSNDYFPRTPFLFLINYSKQICNILWKFHCIAQYPLNQTPPTG